MVKRITVGDLVISPEERLAVFEVLDSNQISPGSKVREFERSFSGRHGCLAGVMTNSGTDALRIALAAVKEQEGWRDGDVILCPSVTFVATVNVVLQLGLSPYLVDVSMYDANMNPDNLEWRLRTMSERSKVKGMIVAHLFGKPAHMPTLMRIADNYGIKVIEDSCETMGVSVGGKPVGSWGEAAAFSFYVAHLLTTGVGGMAITTDPELAEMMRSYENHGRDSTYIPGYHMPALSMDLLKARYRYDRIGYSCRPTEFEAALGLCQLRDLDKMIDKRRFIAQAIDEKVEPHVGRQFTVHGDNACMMFPIIPAESISFDKWELCYELENNGIETRELLPLTNQPCYKGLWNVDKYPVARYLNERAFYLPCHQYMTMEDVRRIGSVFDEFFQRDLTKQKLVV